MATNGVSNGQLANQTTFNNAFVSRGGDTDTTGKLDLLNVAAPSGPTVVNTQREINSLDAFTGRTAGTAFDATPVWASDELGTTADNLQQRVEAIDAAFNDTTGHSHDGSLGGGAPVSAATLDDFNNFIADWQTFSHNTASGLSTIVTADLAGKVAGGTATVAGVYTTAPDNRVVLVNLETETALEDAAGQRVYGRLTEAAGVWTLTYFTNEAGVETAHSLTSQNIRVYFAEVFTMATRPTRGADLGQIPTLDMTADVVDASATQRGVVSTGVQSFAGNKTFTGTIAASNLSGTNTGDVTLAAIGATPNANGASLSGQVLTLQPADSTFGGILTAIAQSILGLKTFVSGVVAQTVLRAEGVFQTAIENDASTGSAQTLPTPGKGIVRLTNAGLVSVTGITAPVQAQEFSLVNRTGVSITILNDAGTAANRILTGTAADMTLASNASLRLIYDLTTAKWQVVGGSSAAGGSFSIDGLTAVSAALDDYVAIADTSDSGNNKKALVSSVKNNAVRSVVTADTATTADETLVLSGASFTEALFSAVGNSGKEIEIRHGGTSWTQIYTIDPNGAETINGAATLLLHTFGEYVRLRSNGANWIIVGRYIPEVWEAVTFTGTWVTNATYSAFQRRCGDSMEFDVSITLSGAPTAASLSLDLPAYVVVDTARLSSFSTGAQQLGSVTVYDDSGAGGTEFVGGRTRYLSTTTVRLESIDNTSADDHWFGNVTNTFPITFATGDIVHTRFIVPVVGFSG